MEVKGKIFLEDLRKIYVWAVILTAIVSAAGDLCSSILQIIEFIQTIQILLAG